MILEEEIGKRIKSQRLKLKLTLQDLSNRTQLSKGYLSKMEKSQKAPPVSTLLNIAKALNVTLSFLFGEINEENAILVVKKDERPILAKPATEFGYSYEALAHSYPNKQMFPYILRFPSNEKKNINSSMIPRSFCSSWKGPCTFLTEIKNILSKQETVFFLMPIFPITENR